MVRTVRGELDRALVLEFFPFNAVRRGEFRDHAMQQLRIEQVIEDNMWERVGGTKAICGGGTQFAEPLNGQVVQCFGGAHGFASNSFFVEPGFKVP